MTYDWNINHKLQDKLIKRNAQSCIWNHISTETAFIRVNPDQMKTIFIRMTCIVVLILG